LELELRKNDAQLRMIADALPTLISYVDASGRFQLINATYERWFGKRRDEIEGRHTRDVLGEQTWAVIAPYMERALSGEAVTYEEHLTYHDGPRWVRVSYMPDRGPDGSVR